VEERVGLGRAKPDARPRHKRAPRTRMILTTGNNCPVVDGGEVAVAFSIIISEMSDDNSHEVAQLGLS